MSDKFEQAEALFHAITAKLPLVDKDDLSILADIMQSLELLAVDPALPQAFQTQAKRTSQLCEKMIMEETPFAGGMRKLTESVEKMGTGLHHLISGADGGDTPAGQGNGGRNGAAPGRDALPDDVKELVIKFASQQQQALENFEALCLDYENNVAEARGGIKRILHTWKGEFGVLDLQDYSQLIHNCEEQLQDETFPADALLRLKDFLAERFGRFAAGFLPAVSEKDVRRLFQPLKDEEEPAGTAAARGSAEQEQPEPAAAAMRTPQDPASGSQTFAGDPSLLSDFVSEAREHLDNAEPLMLELEDDPANADHLNTIFRACHTIKGVAGFLGLTDINHLAHSMENLLDIGRKGEIVLGPTHIDVLLQGMDCLRELIKTAEGMLSGEPYMVPGSFMKVCKKLSNPHGLGDTIEASDKKVGEILVERGVVSPQQVEEAVRKQREGDDRKVGEILMEEVQASPREVAGALASQKAAKQMKSSVEETIRVPIERLDQLIDSIGEAVIAQSMVNAELTGKQLNDRSLEKKVSQANLIMRQIQELSMSLRMVSIRSTFQKMARLVRDLAKKKNKLVELVMEGEDTELDKSVVENIGDPLIHMIRNSLDHGIETADQRKAAGKSEKARVVLRAFHRAGSVVIEVEDDGRGLDKMAILHKAIEKGLVREDQNFSDQEIFQCIFLPGFSTASVVTDVSGRGVGMDVVKRNIESLRGSVEITSEQGKGTTFAIKLPLTLAIIDGMVVRVGEEKYIVPTLSIIESIRPRREQIERVLEKGEAVKVRGSLHTLVRLGNLFNGTKAAKTETIDGVVMIVEDMFGKRIGMYIDDIIGQQQVVIKSLGGGIGNAPGVAGGAIMSDGTVSLILDVGGIVKMATV